MREDYMDYIPEREPITKEATQALEDLHDDISVSFDREERQEELLDE